ncbi:MAG TPA: hypothetical protein VGK34_00185 [Armatimonadota bacterium]
MDTRFLSLKSLLTTGWELFKRRPAEAIVGYLLYAVLGGFSMLIPVVGLLVVFPLMGGLLTLYLKIAKGESCELNDLFSGFNVFGKWVGIGFLAVAFEIACFLPAIIAGVVGSVIESSGRSVAGIEYMLMFPSILLSFCLVVGLSVTYGFGFFSAAEGPGMIEPFVRSAEMTRGIRLQIVWAFLVLTCLQCLVSMVTGGLGFLVTGPLYMLISAAVYLELKSRSANGT